MQFEQGSEQLSIPERTLKTLSFCEPNVRHMNEWIQHLPMVNLSESSRQLYHAIIELNQLIIDPEARLKLLELLRSPIQFVCNGLSKHYLNRPILLPEKPRKISLLAMALDNHMALGYKIVIFDCAQANNSALSRKEKKITTLAIQRAISALTKTIVRSYQLYSPAPKKAWHELNQLYLIAETNGLLETKVEDRENLFLSKITIAEAYKRVLMLGCCKPNQMRQRDIKSIYDTTELWSTHLELGEVETESVYVINLSSDTPPIYQNLARKKLTPFHRGINFSHLLELLGEYLAQSRENHDAFVKGITVPQNVSEDLVRCLLRAWQALTDRAFSRSPSNKAITLCVGFSATHCYISGGIDFNALLQRGVNDFANIVEEEPKASSDNNIFQGREVEKASDVTDTWAGAYDVDKGDFVRRKAVSNTIPVDFTSPKLPTFQAPEEDDFAKPCTIYPKHTAQLIDTSPSGYCIKWQNDIPCEVKTGELVGLNEGDVHSWSLGVIRWINKIDNAETLVGIELLAAGSIPCGAKVVTEGKRKSDYMRAFLLPSHHAESQPASLITPNLPFKEDIKVIVNQYGELSHGFLGKGLLSTASFTQFLYDIEVGEDIHDASDDNIEDLWPDI